MSKIIVMHPTGTADWHALVCEAQARSKICLSEEVESYLVFLLMRFTDEPALAESVLALEYLEGLSLSGKEQESHLQAVGDKCLLFSGLFPGKAERRMVSSRYYVEMGQSSYGLLASRGGDKSLLFSELRRRFESMVDVVRMMRGL